MISVMISDGHSLHFYEDVNRSCPVIPCVLEHMSTADPTIDLACVLRQVVDLAWNVPRGLAIPVHAAMKVGRLSGEMRDVVDEASLSTSSVVLAVDRLICRVLRPLVENVSELAHPLVRPFLEPALLPVVVRTRNRWNGKSNAEDGHDEEHL